MSDEKKTLRTPESGLDERSLAKKYGLRELRDPDSEQIKTMLVFLDAAIESGRCGPIPKTVIVVLADFLQAVLNRQTITKGPRMTNQEFDVLTAPYYIAARTIAKVQRARNESVKGRIYETTYVSLGHFVEVLRNLLDPGCYWLRLRVPEGVIEVMRALRDFLVFYPEQKRKGRAV
ncbi:MAG TPA: hypothetical protein VFO89_17710 [Thermoanaerobaculia bacterium]|nr:hypothetical protein [Thermoanaerobaculia bacterium]